LRATMLMRSALVMALRDSSFIADAPRPGGGDEAEV
jgi:hypothetical protein